MSHSFLPSGPCAQSVVRRAGAFWGRVMPEVRFEANTETVAVLDGYCSAKGQCRTALINSILEQWASEKLHEATVICRVAGINPMAADTNRNGVSHG